MSSEETHDGEKYPKRPLDNAEVIHFYLLSQRGILWFIIGISFAKSWKMSLINVPRSRCTNCCILQFGKSKRNICTLHVPVKLGVCWMESFPANSCCIFWVNHLWILGRDLVNEGTVRIEKLDFKGGRFLANVMQLKIVNNICIGIEHHNLESPVHMLQIQISLQLFVVFVICKSLKWFLWLLYLVLISSAFMLRIAIYGSPKSMFLSQATKMPAIIVNYTNNL